MNASRISSNYAARTGNFRLRIKYLFLTLFLVSGIAGYSQDKNRISLVLGISGNYILRSPEPDGAGTIIGKGSGLAGIVYRRKLNWMLSLESGIVYNRQQLEFTPAPDPPNLIESQKNHLEIISVPVLLDVYLMKGFYINTGPVMDIQIGNSDKDSLHDPSGLGLGFGMGGEINIYRITIDINPVFNFHSIFPFEKQDFQQRIFEGGIHIRAGINF